MKNKILTLTKILVSLVSIYFFSIILIENFSDIPSFKFDNKVFLVFLFFIFVANTLFLPISWFLITNIKNQNVSLYKTIIDYQITQFGKYFPGNFGHYLSRIYIGHKQNIPILQSINYIIIESYWLIAASLAASSFFDFSLFYESNNFFVLKNKIINNNFPTNIIWVLIIFMFFLLLFNFICKIKFFKRSIPEFYSTKSCFFIFINYFLYFLISTYIIQLVINDIHGDVNIPYVNFLSIVCLSWLLGFVIPGAPAGIGVREYVMVLMLDFFIPTSSSLIIVIIIRVMSLISDFINFTIFYTFKLVSLRAK